MVKTQENAHDDRGVKPGPEEQEGRIEFLAELKSNKTNPLTNALHALSAECATLGCIKLDLCDLKASAGVVLRHSIRVLETLFKREEPLIFKIGFSHNPIWRWTNDIYGYRYAREQWSNMIILHFAYEPYTPAMLEAALIEKFQCDYAEIEMLFYSVTSSLRFCLGIGKNHASKLFRYRHGQNSWGRPGCKNIKAGGDTVKPELQTADSSYTTYVVYRSFKCPPPTKKRRVEWVDVFHCAQWIQSKRAIYIHSIKNVCGAVAFFWPPSASETRGPAQSLHEF